MNKRVWFKLGLVALVISALVVVVSCSKADKSDSNERVLTFWQIWVPSSKTAGNTKPKQWEAFELLKNTFEEETGAKLDIVYIANEPYKTQIKAAVAAGNAPDVFFSWPGQRGLDFVKSGAIEDVTEKVKEMVGKNFTQSHADAYLKTGNKHYGFPFIATSKLMFYNTDIFEKYNLSIPKTYEDLINVCKVLREKDSSIAPISIGNGESWQANHYMTILNPRYVDINKVNQDYVLESSNENLFTDPGYVTAFNKIRGLNEADCFQRGANTTKPEVAQTMFASGQSAMYFGGTWYFAVIKKQNPNLKYDVSVFPPSKDQISNDVVSVLSADGFVISSKSKNKDLALKFMDILLSNEVQTKWAESGDIPVNPNADLSSFSEPMQKAVKLIGTIDIPVLWADLGMDQVVSEYYLGATQGVIDGSLTPQDAMKEVRKRALKRKEENK